MFNRLTERIKRFLYTQKRKNIEKWVERNERINARVNARYYRNKYKELKRQHDESENSLYYTKQENTKLLARAVKAERENRKMAEEHTLFRNTFISMQINIDGLERENKLLKKEKKL